jgi:hypothetical protein
MDATELLVHNHLVFRGYSDIVYEPDGNVPPDFLVDGRIAVEVRRLNENERGSSTPRGLEQVAIPLLRRVRALLASFGSAEELAWYVTLRFRRPIPEWRVLERELRAFLQVVRDSGVSTRQGTTVSGQVDLIVSPRTSSGGNTFRLAIESDGDSGGWVLEELERNLLLCVEEKTKKISKVRHRYPEWWLVLADHVAYVISEDDQEKFREVVSLEHTWDRIVLVNPLDHTSYFEL